MRTILIASILLLVAPAFAQAQFPTEWAVVKKGAFVIPSEDLPWTDPEGRAAGKRIGYMRVGTVVRVGACKHVNGPDDESTGEYCNIESEVGVEGKTLKNRLFPLERGKVFAVARKEIVLYDRIDQSKSREKFSRNAGVIIQLLGDWQSVPQSGGVDVISTYNLNSPGAVIKVTIRTSDLIEGTYVIDVPQDESIPPKKFRRERSVSGEWILKGETVSLWSIKPVLKTTADKLSKRVFNEIGWDDGTIEKAQELLSRIFEITTSILDRLKCVTEIEADASAGFELLGSGLKLSGKIPIYTKGKLFDFDVDVVERDGNAQFWILTAKTVICSVGEGIGDSEPKAVEKVTILGIKRHTFEGTPARLTSEYAKRYGLSIPDAVDAYNTPRLFIVSQFGDYVAARNLISKRIANSCILDKMTRQERVILQHAMISKLGEFERDALMEDTE